MKKSEHDHIQKLGARWAPVLAATSLSVRQESKLVGLDKIRIPLATTAALKATLCPDAPPVFTVPAIAGKHPEVIQEIVDTAFAKAVEAGERAFSVVAVAE